MPTLTQAWNHHSHWAFPLSIDVSGCLQFQPNQHFQERFPQFKSNFKFQEQFPHFPGAVSNARKFPVFPGVVDTLYLLQTPANPPPPLSVDGTDRRTPKPSHRPCSAYCAGSVKSTASLATLAAERCHATRRMLLK